MSITVKNLLLQELSTRQTRNSAYSLRAFARDLGLGVTTLSDVLADKRQLSKINLEKVIIKLFVSPLEQELLRASSRDGAHRNRQFDERTLLHEDTFRLIADWQYLAILNLAKIKNNRAGRPKWIANKLGLSVPEAQVALQRLLRLKLVTNKSGRLTRSAKPLTTSTDIPSSAIRKHHSQNLFLAEQSLHHDDVFRREFGSVTMAVNPEKLQLAKDLLLKTRKKIAALLEVGTTSEVYTLSFQLFPLTKFSRSTEEK